MGMSRDSVSVAFVFSLAASGCLTFGQGGSQDDEGAGEPGFAVAADPLSSTCGSNQLDLEAAWSFTVQIETDPEAEIVTWDDGTRKGEVALELEDLSFTVTSTKVVDMRTSEEVGWLPPCRIRRTDRVEATLDDAEEPTALEGKMSFSFEPTDESDCSDILAREAPVIAKLPCEAKFEIEGELR